METCSFVRHKYRKEHSIEKMFACVFSYAEAQHRLHGGSNNFMKRQSSPITRVSDQGYESGTWSKEDLEHRQPVHQQEWTMSR